MSGGWFEGLPGRKPRRKPRPKPEPDPEPDSELEDHDPDEGLRCVAWLPIRCPYCGSTSQRNYKTRRRVRYHLCQDCGERYKSLEVQTPE